MINAHDVLLSREARPVGVLASLGLAEAPPEISPTWVSGALRGIAMLWPLILLAKICVSAIVHVPFGFVPYNQVLEGGIALAVLTVDACIIASPRLTWFGDRAPHVQNRAMVVLAFLSGTTFSLWTGVATEVAAGHTIFMLAPAMVVALLAMCIFGNRRVFGLSYVLGALLVPTLQQGSVTMGGLLFSCVAVLTIATLRQAVADRKRETERNRREQQAYRSDRLLQEYEIAGRGWFWETDRQGCLTYISQTLVRTLDMNDERPLAGRPITDMVCAGDRQQGDGERTLGFHLSARTAFSDIAVRAAMSQEERWWAISGRPVFNEFGQFHGFRGSGADLTEMRRSQAEVTRLAQYDSLTGLANRVQMLRSLEQAVAGTGGQPGNCTLMMLDLDRFKSVNDTLGHPAGDALLRQVSQRLQRVVGDLGLVGRQGGDEFKIILPGQIAPAVLDDLAKTIISVVSHPYTVESQGIVIGVSIGISSCPCDGVTADALIRNADLALYAAKGDGRGVYRIYSPDMHADAEDRRQLEEDLRHALMLDALHLAYQPVVDAVTEEISGYEALLRWEHPVRGAISPTIFIPIAEEIGLIPQIGEWVLRTACRDAAQWPESIRVAVNVSPIQFANPALPALVMSALAAAQLDAGRLELEITEGVFLNDDEGTDAMFASLKRVGVRLALDDFGTGYSSLGYLKKAPFDKIKIDQSFVRGAAIAGSRNSAIIKAIVSLADALSMDTTAEGAETHDELDLIRQLGCSHIQGYIYGRPISAVEVLANQRAGGVAAHADGFRSSRPDRKSMLRTITIRHDDHAYVARIRNISVTGALIEGLWNVPVGTVVEIELFEGKSVNATARWSHEDRTGVEFASAVDLARLHSHMPPRALAS